MANKYEHEIPEGYEARIEGNKVVIEKVNEDERTRKEIIEFIEWAESRGSVRHDWHQEKKPGKWVEWLGKVGDINRDYISREDHERIRNEYYLQGVEDGKKQNPQTDLDIINEHIRHDYISGDVNKRLADCGWYVGEEKPEVKAVQWKGGNLKEVVDFTGKSPRFDEWFKSWLEYEDYVHSHGDIFKMFNEDGTHYEVPVGAWIVKTPDGHFVPSKGEIKQKPAVPVLSCSAAWFEDGEQKPEEEYPNLSNCMKDCKNCPGKCIYRKEPYAESGWNDTDYACFDIIMSLIEEHATEEDHPEYIKEWFKSVKPNMKQEWDKEENYIYGNILNYYASIPEPTDQNGIPKEKYVQFIKSLRPSRPKQEWSENDRTKLNDIIRIIEGSGNVKSVRDHYITWLKSLPENFRLNERASRFRNPQQKSNKEIREKLENIYSVIKQSVFKHEVSQLREIIESLK